MRRQKENRSFYSRETTKLVAVFGAKREAEEVNAKETMGIVQMAIIMSMARIRAMFMERKERIQE